MPEQKENNPASTYFTLSGFTYLLLRLICGAVFAFAGFSKLIQPSQYFQIAVHFYQVLPDAWIPMLSFILPWLELILGTFLILGYSMRQTSTALLCLIIGLQLMLGQAILRGLFIDQSGCFSGMTFALSAPQMFVFNTILFYFLLKLAGRSIALKP